MRPGWKYVSYEIAFAAGTQQQRVNFLINNYLVGRKIYNLTVYTSNDMAHSPVTTANVLWTPAQILEASLTLYCFDPANPGGGPKAEWIKDMPVNALHVNFNTQNSVAGSSTNRATDFAGLEVDFNKSYITFAQPITPSVGTSALFGVYYGD